MFGTAHWGRQRSRRFRSHLRAVTAVAVVAATSAVVVPIVLASASSAASAKRTVAPSRDGLGIQPGKIKHVWLIILENKSYDATFTGLNKNTYLWRTLPGQGVLLKNYYGTGHFSFDNYLASVSGQATQPDTQADCSVLRPLRGPRRHLGVAADEPQLRSDDLRPGPERDDRRQRLRVPGERADAVQAARRGQGELEGLCPGSRQPRRERPAT